MSACRDCMAPLLWAKTERGNPIPLDAKPVANGGWTITSTGDGHIAKPWRDAVAVVDDAEPESNSPADLGVVTTAPPSRGLRYASHFATCTAATQRRAR